MPLCLSTSLTSETSALASLHPAAPFLSNAPPGPAVLFLDENGHSSGVSHHVFCVGHYAEL